MKIKVGPLLLIVSHLMCFLLGYSIALIRTNSVNGKITSPETQEKEKYTQEKLYASDEETNLIHTEETVLDYNTEEPSVPEPTKVQPQTKEPTATQPPVTQPLATQPLATQPPATQPPATQPPATQPPATQPPATQPPEVNMGGDTPAD